MMELILPIVASLAKTGLGMIGMKKKKDKYKQLPLFTPSQNKFMETMLQSSQPGMLQGMDYLTKMLSGDESSYNKFAQPYMNQFNQEIVPQLAERFAGVDAQSSSAFGQSLGGAGGNLMANLAALREGLKSQALSQLQSMSSIGTQQRFENMYKQADNSGAGKAAKMAGQGTGDLMDALMALFAGMGSGGTP